MAKQVTIKASQLTGTTSIVGTKLNATQAGTTITDNSGESLTTCIQAINSTAADLATTVSKYSEFLNSIADKFKETDYQISSKIKNDKSYITDGKVNPSDDYFAAK